MNPIILLQINVENDEKIKKGDGIFILDWSHLENPSLNSSKHPKINFIQTNNLHPTL